MTAPVKIQAVYRNRSREFCWLAVFADGVRYFRGAYHVAAHDQLTYRIWRSDVNRDLAPDLAVDWDKPTTTGVFTEWPVIAVILPPDHPRLVRR